MYDVVEPSLMSTVTGPPASEHPFTVYLYVTSNRSMDSGTVQVMVRVVAVGEVTRRLFTADATMWSN